MDRRTFLASIGAAGVGTLVPGLSGCTQAPGTARGAGTAAGTAGAVGSPPLGVQLYTLRSEMAKGVDATLARLASLGFREVEFAGYFDRTPAQIRESLARHGLTSPSAHYPIEALEGDRQAKSLADAVAAGHRWVVVPWLAPEARRTIDDYRRVTARLNRIGEAARRSGLSAAYHNHEFELAPLGGEVPLDVMLKESDPALVNFELDVFWTVRGGADPFAYFARWPGRFPMLHLKDSAGAPDHRMVEVGAGTIDWRRVLERGVAQGGVRHAFVEHDNPTDPWASVTASAAHLKKL